MGVPRGPSSWAEHVSRWRLPVRAVFGIRSRATLETPKHHNGRRDRDPRDDIEHKVGPFRTRETERTRGRSAGARGGSPDGC